MQSPDEGPRENGAGGGRTETVRGMAMNADMIKTTWSEEQLSRTLRRNKVKGADVQPVGTIFATDNYSIFKGVKGNRKLSAAHLKKLKSSIEEQALFSPILVNDRFEIIDGQHRFATWKDLGMPVLFIIQPNYELPEIQRLNVNHKNWSTNDYMNTYIDLGIQSYKDYRTLKEKYPFNHTVLLGIIHQSDRREQGQLAEFKAGKLARFDTEKAVQTADQIMELEKYFEKFTSRSFVYAYLKVLKSPDFNHQDFIMRLDKGHQLHAAITTENYLRQIESIVNYRRQKRVRLF